MPKPAHQKALDTLIYKEKPLRVLLRDGRALVVYDVAWGQDLGDAVAHITTNTRPTPDEAPPIAFFSADEVIQIEALSGEVWFAEPTTEQTP